MTFDEQVAAMRGRVDPKPWSRVKKADATPEQWASRLDYYRKVNGRHAEANTRRALEWRACHAERSRTTAASRYQSQRERIRLQHSVYYAENRGSIYESNRKWHAANRGRVREWHAGYKRSRRRGDVVFLIADRLRGRLYSAVKRGHRSGSAVRDLGCSIPDLKAHLERQFLPGMSWENWGAGPGKWQIDHIYPLAKADLTDRLCVLAACNWRNLQPLWFDDNMRKGDTVTPEAQQLFDGLVLEFSQTKGGA
jgi:hypothetical protein